MGNQRTAGRLLKHLAAMGVVTETGPDEYCRNGLSAALGMARYNDAWQSTYALNDSDSRPYPNLV